MDNLGEFINKAQTGINIVFDEFQEITELNGLQIEGILRSHASKDWEKFRPMNSNIL